MPKSILILYWQILQKEKLKPRKLKQNFFWFFLETIERFLSSHHFSYHFSHCSFFPKVLFKVILAFYSVKSYACFAHFLYKSVLHTKLKKNQMEVEALLATWQAAFSLAARHRSGCTGISDVLLFLTSVLVLRASVPSFWWLL